MRVKSREPRLRPESFPELQRTADLIGEFIEYWGFKRVHGRIWAHLYLSGEALNTRQLVQLLQVSNALVCNSVAELLHYKVILEAGKGRNGVLQYRANPDVGRVVAGVLRSRELKLLAEIQASYDRAAGSPALRKDQPYPVNRERLELLGRWIELARGALALGIGAAGTDFDPFAQPERAMELLPDRACARRGKRESGP